jgi:hypothetical protein
MTIFYLDYEGGNDTLDGKSFANRRKTISSLTATQTLAAGDTVRVMASPDPTLVGNATWTQYSKTVTLAAAVTATISQCETAWTPSTNITASTTTSNKQGTNAITLAVGASFTTGKMAYSATGTLDLSAYQQVTFWIKNTVAITAGQYSLRLCSDTAGATSVHTVAIPAIPSTSEFVALTVNLSANMSSSIQSVAMYRDSGTGTPTITLDCILACKASSSADSLSLTSLIGKMCNLSWVASTTYASGDQCRPTQPNRNGYRYQASAGTTGTTEPTWPNELNATVTDGTVTWTCIGLEDTWYCIQSISGTTVTLDSDVNSSATTGQGYPRATETVATYKREPVATAMASSSATTVHQTNVAGTSETALVTYTGGWSRTDMSTQTGETWYSGQNGWGYAFFQQNAQPFIKFQNLSPVRYSQGFGLYGANSYLFNCHSNSNSGNGVNTNNANPLMRFVGCCFSHNSTSNFADSQYGRREFIACSANCSANTSGWEFTGTNAISGEWNTIDALNNWLYGVNKGNPSPLTIRNLTTANSHSTIGVSAQSGALTLVNPSIGESTPFNTLTYPGDSYVYCQKYQRTADNHYIVTDSGTIKSATDQRHTASGISWKFNPTGTNRKSGYPLRLALGRYLLAANTTATFSIWVRRDNTNINGRLMVAGGQLLGMPSDTTVDCAPAINTWVQYSLSVTPTEIGVVEVVFLCWDGVGTTNSLWIDDLAKV